MSEDDKIPHLHPRSRQWIEDCSGALWRKLPLKVRQMWWRETDYNRLPPSPEFTARLPEVLAAAQVERENERREIAADIVRAQDFLRQARRPPCEECLRPASPCKVRCLRSVLSGEP
jgi:hypothetical protein